MNIKEHFFKDGKFVKQSVRAKKYDAFFAELSLRFGTSNRSELLWLSENSRPVCRECGGDTKFLNFESGYRQLCSNKCAQANDLTKHRRVKSIKNFFTVHHKVENSAQLQETKDKISETCMTRYGTPWYVETVGFKESSKQTSLKNWGTSSPQQSDLIKEQVKKSIFAKYGRTTARSFEENRLARIALVEEWCESMGIMAPVFQTDVNLGTFEYAFTHNCGTQWTQQVGTLLPVCPVCHRGSKVEQSVKEWVASLNVPVRYNDRHVIKPLELDIFMPEHNVAIEVNGLYWHHDDSGRTSVKDKTDLCEAQGVQLISIWENEWHDEHTRRKIKGMICSKLGLGEKIFARKTKLRKLTLDECRDFLNTYHLQGWASSSVSYGLFYEDELVMSISVGIRRWNGTSEREIIRLCSKSGVNIVGGFSKLLKMFSNEPLLSYCDRRFGNGAGYKRVGFTLDRTTKPNYQWWKGNVFLKRGSTTRKRLPGLLGDMYDPDFSENDNMRASGFKKLSDAGNLRFVLLPKRQ